MNRRMPSPGRRLIILGALAVTVTGCASTGPADAGPDPGNDSSAYPVTVENCGEKVVFETAPQRVVLLESAPVTVLDGLGVLDRVVSRAGAFSPEYYDADLAQRIEGIEMLSEDIDASGHLMINAEAVIAQKPDLVLGLPEGLTREGLRDSGANTLVHPVFCGSGVGAASFQSLYELILLYGEIFDRAVQAEQLVTELDERVADVERRTADPPPRTAAVLYPSTGGGPVYAYGRASMSQPQLEAAGFTNVFADIPERVFEVSIEELLHENPDVLILLHQGEDTGVLEAITNLPGGGTLQAVRNGDTLVQLFNFTEPPTPLSVVGLERIVDRFGTGS